MRFRTVAGLILAGYLLGVAREFRQTGRLLAWRFTEPELAALNGGAQRVLGAPLGAKCLDRALF